MSMPAIELKNVAFTYAQSEAAVIENVNFILNFGEFALLSGASGAGKSTVLGVMSGILPNVYPGELSGEILVAGESVLGKPLREICRKVGVVLQNADAQIIQQKVADEIAFGCENFGFGRERIREQIRSACGKTQLSPDANTRTLSGGQKQRLITASTLATAQRIIILDEPLANLDAKSADLLMKTLKALAQNGYAVLIIEHRMDMVLKYVDTVWVLENKTLHRQAKGTDPNPGAQCVEDTCTRAPEEHALLSLANVSYAVKDHRILHGFTLEIKRGERLLLLGENGCGKTTLLRLLAGLYQPSGGQLRQSIVAAKQVGGKAWFRQVGVVYQNPDYQLFMPTVRQEILFGAKDAQTADAMLRLFGLEHLAQAHPQSLSEGQKRRLTVAAVAAGMPAVLLLDEPTVGQDYEALKKMIETINQLHNATGNTIITVTHDRRCAAALCDRAVIMDGGRVRQSGGKELIEAYFSEQEEKNDD